MLLYIPVDYYARRRRWRPLTLPGLDSYATGALEAQVAAAYGGRRKTSNRGPSRTLCSFTPLMAGAIPQEIQAGRRPWCTGAAGWTQPSRRPMR
jgi:hypothetical protein